MVIRFNGCLDSLLLDTNKGVATFSRDKEVRFNGISIYAINEGCPYPVELHTDKALKEFANSLVLYHHVYLDITGVSNRNKKFYAELVRQIHPEVINRHFR